MVPPLKKIEWQAPEYEFHQKSPDWFWGVGIITVAVFIASVLSHNFLFGVLAVLAGFSVSLYAARKPKTITFRIDHNGIKTGSTIYPYESIKCFWINEAHEEMLIESKKSVMPHITISLVETDSTKVKKFLLNYLKEEEIKEALLPLLAKIIFRI